MCTQIHTTSRCRSPLISIASRLSMEHGRAGKVTSNCTFKKTRRNVASSQITWSKCINKIKIKGTIKVN